MESQLLQTWSAAIKHQSYFTKHPIHQPELADIFCEAILHGRYNLLAENLESILEYLNGNRLSREVLIDSLFLLRDKLSARQKDSEGISAAENSALCEIFSVSSSSSVHTAPDGRTADRPG